MRDIILIILLSSIIPIAVVGVVVLRYGRDRRVKSIGWVQALMIVGLMIVGLIPLGLQVLCWVMFGCGELSVGHQEGLQWLVPLAATVLLAFLAWTRPIEGGVALLIVGLTALALTASDSVRVWYGLDATAKMIMAAPQLVSGGLFLAGGLGAWVISRRKQDRGN
ncbi:MAG: hypothetical protein MUP64_13735 [Anaerolineae bacterium]|nr:hypothetical protein [Anaerolineae bacterium]